MQSLLIGLIVLHVLPGVFWAGSSFVLARTAAVGVERFAFPQVAAATVTIIAGMGLWRLTHAGVFATSEKVLATGAVCALAAAVLQVIALPAVRRLRSSAGGAGRDRAKSADSTTGRWFIGDCRHLHDDRTLCLRRFSRILNHNRREAGHERLHHLQRQHFDHGTGHDAGVGAFRIFQAQP
jgi:hypothetical protein